MNIFVIDQLYIFTWAVIFGGLLGLFYDFIRIFRRLLPHEKLAIGIEDLLFWFVAGIIIFGYVFNTNDGIMRGFIFIGLSLGAILYFGLLSSLIVNKVTRIISKVIKLILSPIRILTKPIHIFIKNTTKGLKKREKWLIIKTKAFLKEIRFIINKI
jgi:spore cortex biosynthesis protein YabQ